MTESIIESINYEGVCRANWAPPSLFKMSEIVFKGLFFLLCTLKLFVAWIEILKFSSLN